MVCASYSDRKILIAAFVASPDILLRNVMASSQNSIPNSSQVNLDIFGSDIDKHNLKSTVPSVQHHLQVIPSCECCLHRETLGVLQVLRGRLEHLASSRNRTQDGRCRLQRVCDDDGWPGLRVHVVTLEGAPSKLCLGGATCHYLSGGGSGGDRVAWAAQKRERSEIFPTVRVRGPAENPRPSEVRSSAPLGISAAGSDAR